MSGSAIAMKNAYITIIPSGIEKSILNISFIGVSPGHFSEKSTTV
jgi:hypothetical protein